MSGSGKTTLANYAEVYSSELGLKSKIIDGDDVRSMDGERLGFDFNDIALNNMRIAKLCLDLKEEGFDILFVPVISPYKKVRSQVQNLLEPYLRFIYIKANIKILKARDTKGLYSASDRGEIDNLIGYSLTNPYEEPFNHALTIDTGKNTVDESKKILSNFIKNELFKYY